MLVVAAAISVGFGFLAPATTSYAACTSAAGCVTAGIDSTGGGKSSKTASVGDIVERIVRILLFIIGAVSVIMIIIGGIRYTISQGDAGNVKAAKDTILYAVVGLIVALLAYAIVNFVVDNIAK